MERWIIAKNNCIFDNCEYKELFATKENIFVFENFEGFEEFGHNGGYLDIVYDNMLEDEEKWSDFNYIDKTNLILKCFENDAYDKYYYCKNDDEFYKLYEELTSYERKIELNEIEFDGYKQDKASFYFFNYYKNKES